MAVKNTAIPINCRNSDTLIIDARGSIGYKGDAGDL
jgi:hypothetical protein